MALALALLLTFTAPAAAVEPLKVARELSETKFSGWTYGSDPAKKQIDCVQFVLAVVEKSVEAPLTEDVRKGILISNLTAGEAKPDNLSKLILSADERTKGIQSALVKAGLGEPVEPEDAKPGDFVQYWMKKSDGKWFGHASILEEVTTVGGVPQATLLGSHKGQNGIAVSTFKLKLKGDPAQRRVYLLRLK